MMQQLSVAQLNIYLKALLDSDMVLQDIWIAGEVSNFTRHTSGHCYFTLKEGDATIAGVCWRGNAQRLIALPRNGDAVLAHGKIGYYEARGQIQLVADTIRSDGVGVLQAQYERLLAQLDAEGLFDASRKRPIPQLPQRIGLVTSPTGAALQDMLTILRRRYPLAEVTIAACQVQGSGAADSVVEALYALYDDPPDVIIVARGGGSIEDLWTFNEEIVARAVFASPVPLISGVGHETDTTIIDFVADLRAPTPSAAAELVAPDIADLADAMAALRGALDDRIDATIDVRRDGLNQLGRRLDLASPLSRIEHDRQSIDELTGRMGRRVASGVELRGARLDGLRAQLAALNPEATLGRGFAIVRRADGGVVTRADQTAPGEILDITVREGSFAAQRLERAS